MKAFVLYARESYCSIKTVNTAVKKISQSGYRTPLTRQVNELPYYRIKKITDKLPRSTRRTRSRMSLMTKPLLKKR